MPSNELHLWDFSLALYASPGVAECCLQLQDHSNVNVNVLLWSIWLEQRRIHLSPERLATALEQIQRWDTHYVQALRKLRQSMKTDFAQNLGLIAPVRDKIKQAELLAEKQEQQWLESLADNWSIEIVALKEGENITTYLGSMNISSKIMAQAVSDLTSKYSLTGP